jgi:hypothetical protein
MIYVCLIFVSVKKLIEIAVIATSSINQITLTPMAILNNDEIQFTGSVGKMTAYKMYGSDKVVVRLKKGPTKKQIRHSPRFERTRQNNSEFKGAIEAVKNIRGTMSLSIRRLADYNFTPVLTGICSNILQQEKVNERGKRGVLLSGHRKLLEGFRINRKNPFVNVVTNPLTTVIDREAKKAVVELPRLIKGINFILPWKHPVYRFCLSLGIADDVIYDGNSYTAARLYGFATANTEWHMNGAPFLPQTIELKMDTPVSLKDSQTLILSIGIEMGAPDKHGEIDNVRYAGSACILALG